MKNVKVALVGAGSMGKEHLKAFSALEGVKIAGIHSRTKERSLALQKIFEVEHVYNSIEELYHRTRADVVIIAVPEVEANCVAKQCFQYPWLVLMEKPAGYDYVDAMDIAAAALRSNAQVYVGLNRRFYSSVRSIMEDLNSSAGSRYIHIQDQQNFSEAYQYGHPACVVEKFMYANSIHTIDLILAFARGQISRIEPIKPWKGEQTDVMLVHIEFDSGDHALYEGHWQGPGPWACSVNTPTKRWMLQPLEIASLQKKGERQRVDIPMDECDKQFKPGFYHQAREVINKIRGQESRAITLKESMRTMQLIHNMFGV
ncbi:MAG TPA: Gfo/Idh/MocA family oxidoreductase [Coxiellaceae bacterium]|nr:Gfo/Idh/MocA family oxidoreductase [Coxiellaceae bacterium]